MDLSPLAAPLRATMAGLPATATAADAIALLPGVLARMDPGPPTERLTHAAYVARLEPETE